MTRSSATSRPTIDATTGTKPALLIALTLWTSVIVYAYAFLQTTAQAWAMGAVIALFIIGTIMLLLTDTDRAVREAATPI